MGEATDQRPGGRHDPRGWVGTVAAVLAVAGLAATAAFVVSRPAPEDPVVQPTERAPAPVTTVPEHDLAELVAAHLAAELSTLTGVTVSTGEGRCLADEVIEILGPDGRSALLDRGLAGVPTAGDARLPQAVVRCLGPERAAAVLRVHVSDGGEGTPLPGED